MKTDIPEIWPEIWLTLALAGIAAVLAILAYLALARTYRARSGRPYGEVVEDLYRESERRGELLASWAGAFVQRVDRAERR